MPKRWYDKDATVSLAISMLKNSSDDIQDAACLYINKQLIDMNIKQNESFIIFKFFDKRWYDEKENVYNVMEAMRCCNATQRKKIALALIDHLCKIAVP